MVEEDAPARWLEQAKEVGRKGRHLVRLGVLGATAREHDLRRTLVVVGSRRSGTTWLLEMLTSIPRAAVLFEPFHPDHVPEAGSRGLHLARHVDPVGSFEHREFVLRALRGRIRCRFTLDRLPPLRAFRPHHWLVKFVRANYLLPWMTEAFPIPAPVLIVRHPCAVVASYLRLGGEWVERASPKLFGPLAREPGLAELVDGLRTAEERCAAFWAIENRIALGMTRPERLTVVSYEHLYRNGPAELERVFERWGVPMPRALPRRFGTISTTTQLEVRGKFGSGTVLRTWRDELGPDRAERVLEVARRFGFDAYSDAELPDRTRLEAMIGRDRTERVRPRADEAS